MEVILRIFNNIRHETLPDNLIFAFQNFAKIFQAEVKL